MFAKIGAFWRWWTAPREPFNHKLECANCGEPVENALTDYCARCFATIW